MTARHLILAVPGLALAVGGCAPALEFAPVLPVASNGWSDGESYAGEPPAVSLGSLMGSPRLQDLTQRALSENREIRIAEARIEQAAALRLTARQATLPSVSLSAGAAAERRRRGSVPDLEELFASLDLAIDPDLFGRLAAARRRAQADVEFANYTRDAIALAIETEVAATYVEYAALKRRIAIVEQNIARQAELERIIRIRFEEGVANRVDLGLQTIQMLNLRTDRSRLEEALVQTRNAMAILVGEEAPLFALETEEIGRIALPDMRPETPAQLLASRPDVRAAEAVIASASGSVREARARFFPQVEIGLSGVARYATGGIFEQAVTLGSSLLAPIFDRGRLTGDFRFATARQVEAVEGYRQTILIALSEVEDALVSAQRSSERAVLFEQIVDEARETEQLANLQYLEGEESLQSVLDAQRFLSNAEEAQVLARQSQMLAQISLYRSMGGFKRPEKGLSGAQRPNGGQRNSG